MVDPSGEEISFEIWPLTAIASQYSSADPSQFSSRPFPQTSSAGGTYAPPQPPHSDHAHAAVHTRAMVPAEQVPTSVPQDAVSGVPGAHGPSPVQEAYGVHAPPTQVLVDVPQFPQARVTVSPSVQGVGRQEISSFEQAPSANTSVAMA